MVSDFKLFKTFNSAMDILTLFAIFQSESPSCTLYVPVEDEELELLLELLFELELELLLELLFYWN